jgi:hypothetical protein
VRPDELNEASYRGAVFFVTSASRDGGRKDVVKSFVSSDRQTVEDLGLRQPTFTIEGVVAAQLDNTGAEIRSYTDVRRELLLALERGGPGVLVHPFYGRLEGIHARTYSLRESMTQLGDAAITITFAISNADGLPTVETTVLGEVSSANTAVLAAAEADIADRFSVTAEFIGNFEAASEKVSAAFDAINSATAPFAALADQIDGFSAELADLGADITGLVNNPEDLSTSLRGLLTTMGGLYATPAATYGAFSRLFPFGDGDVAIQETTGSRIERARNAGAVNTGLQAMALAGAYFAASKLDLKNEAEIDQVSGSLEAQFQKLSETPQLSADVLSELSEMRISVTKFFDEQRVTKPRIVEVVVNPQSVRLLSFARYGSSEFGDDIAKLNGIYDGALVSGRLKILTEDAAN